MYAVIVSGGKQHRVIEGEVLKLEKIEVETGGTLEFDKVLLVVDGDDIKVGAPVVAGAKVTAEVVSHGRHEVIAIQFHRLRQFCGVRFAVQCRIKALSVHPQTIVGCQADGVAIGFNPLCEGRFV